MTELLVNYPLQPLSISICPLFNQCVLRDILFEVFSFLDSIHYFVLFHCFSAHF